MLSYFLDCGKMQRNIDFVLVSLLLALNSYLSIDAERYFCSDFRFFATVPSVMTNNFNKVVKLMATSSLIDCCYNLSSFEDVSCMMFPTRRSLQSAKNILTNLCKLSMTYQNSGYEGNIYDFCHSSKTPVLMCTGKQLVWNFVHSSSEITPDRVLL